MERCALVLSGTLLLLGPACRSTWYAAMERFGFEKRDLLVERVEDARGSQEHARDEFRDAYARLRDLVGFEGGELEEAYEALRDELAEAEGAADAVRARIRAVQSVAADLFEEWAQEIEELQDPQLKARSRVLLGGTRESYARLDGALQRAEQRMDPVLVALRDQVLFLKHSLNARAVQGLEATTVEIRADVEALIEALEAAIAQAGEFVADMGAA